jgi:hypothetical protein
MMAARTSTARRRGEKAFEIYLLENYLRIPFNRSSFLPPLPLAFLSLYQYLETRYNSNLSEAENSIAQKVYRLRLPPYASFSAFFLFAALSLSPLTCTTMRRNIVVKKTFLIMYNGSFKEIYDAWSKN